jgi:predicted N-acetyltransferase YhbS
MAGPMVQEIEIVPETGDHVAGREALLDRVMGPVRFRRACARLRAGRMPAPGLSFVALGTGGVSGTVRLWPVRAAGLENALLLGPLAVETGLSNRGIGARLVIRGIGEAARQGYRAIVLVGDPEYYARFGFDAAEAAPLAVPGPFERHRLLGLALEPGAFEHAHGTLLAAGARLARAAPAALARAA